MKVLIDDIEYEIPENYYFTKTHEWLLNTPIKDEINKQEKYLIGISDYLQTQLGEISIVELMPQSIIGSVITQADQNDPNEDDLIIPDVTIESAKTVINIHSPITGIIINANSKVKEDPELLNSSPYEKGWLYVIDPQNINKEIKNLMNGFEYIKFLRQLKS